MLFGVVERVGGENENEEKFEQQQDRQRVAAGSRCMAS